MPRYSGLVRAVDDIARVQHGVVARRQMLEAGIPNATVSSWATDGRGLTRILPGIYLVGRQTPDQRQRETAALLHCRGQGMLTGVTALAHLGAPYLPAVAEESSVHVLVEAQRDYQSVGFVLVERTHRFPVSGGPEPPIVPVARAVFDACRRHHRDLRRVRATVLGCLQAGLMTPQELHDEIAEGQRRWTKNLRQALGEFRLGLMSAPEAELREVALAAGLAAFEWNPNLYDDHGQWIGCPDAYDPTCGLAVEVDSREHHSDAAGWSRTLRRNRRYEAAGILVVAISPQQIREDPDAVIRHISRTRESLLGRTPPAVNVQPHAAA
jgi:hypothetical protein